MSLSTSTVRNCFDQFGLQPALVRGVEAIGFETPRQMQLESIPAGLEGWDVLGLAQTGTGKKRGQRRGAGRRKGAGGGSQGGPVRRGAKGAGPSRSRNSGGA